MRSFNRARLADIVEKNLNPKEKLAVGKDGRLTPSSKSNLKNTAEEAVTKEEKQVLNVSTEKVETENLKSKPEEVIENKSEEPLPDVDENQLKKVEKKTFKKKVSLNDQSS